MFASAVDGSDRVDYVPGREPSARSDNRFTCGQGSNLVHDLTAFGEDGGTSSTMNRTVHAASTQQ
jgi:hypothetical protein